MMIGVCLALLAFSMQDLVAARSLDTDRFLSRFGYAEKPSELNQNDEHSRSMAIRKYQSSFGLDITGMMNEATYEHMKTPRCGLPDYYTSPSDFSLSGRRWNSTYLRYKILNGPAKTLNWTDAERAIANGFKYWSDISKLNFNATASGHADFVVAFSKRDHGDGRNNQFDGKGGVLAHAFYPQNGRIHFDDEEDWTQKTTRGINLEIVAAHEIGHALGLGHTFVKGALMYPTYQGYSPGYKLHKDDISGMDAIYGEPVQRKTTPPPQDVEKVCDLKAFKAAVNVDSANNSISYIFSEKHVFEMQGSTQLEKALVKDMFPQGPSRVVAATYFRSMDRILLIYGRTVYHYSRDKKFLRKSQLHKALPYNPDVIFAWYPKYKKSFFVLFRGRKMYTYDLLSGRYTGPHTTARYFKGLPHSLHSAFYHVDGYLYFFKGRRFWKVHKVTRKIVWNSKKIEQSPVCTDIGSIETKKNRRKRLKGRSKHPLPAPWKKGKKTLVG